MDLDNLRQRTVNIVSASPVGVTLTLDDDPKEITRPLEHTTAQLLELAQAARDDAYAAVHGSLKPGDEGYLEVSRIDRFFRVKTEDELVILAAEIAQLMSAAESFGNLLALHNVTQRGIMVSNGEEADDATEAEAQ